MESIKKNRAGFSKIQLYQAYNNYLLFFPDFLFWVFEGIFAGIFATDTI